MSVELGHVGPVDVVDFEAEVAVETDGPFVGGIDVEHAGADTALGQAGQPPEDEGLAEPRPLGTGVDGDDVDLAQPVVMDLGPAEAGQLTVALGEQEPRRVEPRLGLALGQGGPVPSALLDVALEGPVVDGQPGVFVLPG
jgi:hypothetical protein